MVFFTADQHFGHRNIIKACARPFSSIDEMHDVLIENHNAKVKPGDTVYHLGDFAFGHHRDYLAHLNGEHHLILGNHDSGSVTLLKKAFASVAHAKYVKTCGHKFYLSHFSHRVWRSSHYGAFHLYGHSHGTLPGFGRSMDVGVDTNAFSPYSAEEIIQSLSGVDPAEVDYHRKAFSHVLG